MTEQEPEQRAPRSVATVGVELLLLMGAAAVLVPVWLRVFATLMHWMGFGSFAPLVHAWFGG